MADNPARRNHYLPQFYLRRFCDGPDGVLRTFLGPDDQLHEGRFALKETGHEWDLYTQRDAGILSSVSEPDRIEKKVFGPIDDNGADAVKALLEGAPSQLSTEERSHVAVFVNALIERHPQRIREHDRKAEQMARERLDSLKEAFGGSIPGRPNIFDLVGDDHIEQLARNLHREHIVREIHDEKVLAYIAGMKMSKFTLAEEHPFRLFTGDNPVLINGGRPWPMQFFTLTLSPRVLLVGVNDEEPVTEPQMIIGLVLVHCLELLCQSEYVFSQQSLVDYEGVAIRTAALQSLKRVDWRRK